MEAAAPPDIPVAMENAVDMSFGCIGFACPGTVTKFPAPADQTVPLVFMLGECCSHSIRYRFGRASLIEKV